ncbi:MAG: adenylate/guanylate cyclase domain-containing protein [Anaerolineae bacterium]|nr:MAG: adenylate/guanylate cyclase domain-containing protein [Anaerolineae bacterium]
MEQPTLVETFASYVPDLILKRVLADPAPITSPVSESFQAAVLFADISGFTEVTTVLSQRGPAGAETLANLLNNYFGKLIDIILANGGDVVKFAGDALIALWPVEGPSLRPAILRAASCGQQVQTALKDFSAEGVQLSLKIAISAGAISQIHIGGVFSRWEFLLDGAPLVEVGLANDVARAGQVILGPSACEAAQDGVHGPNVDFPNGHSGKLLERISATLPLPQPTQHPQLSEELAVRLKAYIPGAINDRLSVGQSGWLAELRRLTVLFINLPGLNAAASLESGQQIARLLQTSLYYYEGSINKLNVDDKGVTLVAALGLPPFAHEDDAARGVRAALRIRRELNALGIESYIGITSGLTFCGSVGNDRRREYTMIGDVVNLSARLMGLAKQQIELKKTHGVPILVDRATYEAAKDQAEFEILPEQHVKGKADKVAVFHPLVERTDTVRAASEMIGRDKERTLLADALQTLQRGQSARTIIIRGEAGIGKSRLLEDLFRQSKSLKLTSYYGTLDAIDRNSPFHAWREIFRQVFELNVLPELQGTAQRDVHQAQVLKYLERTHPQYLLMAPLLNILLPIDLPDNDLTSAMSAEVRGNNILEIMTDLLAQRAEEHPLLLVFDDLQWFDSASWALAGRVSRSIEHLLLVLSSRPIAEEDTPEELAALLAAPNTTLLDLESFTQENVAALIRQRLGAQQIPAQLVNLIWSKAAGHPFYSEELLYALRDTGLVVVESGQCRMATAEQLDSLSLPDTLQGIVTSRIDRLPPSEKLALKVASVIGREFLVRALEAIYPIENDKPNLNHYLTTLRQLSFTTLLAMEPELSYLFKHAVTHEVAYGLMLFGQRRQLHQDLARWLESTYAADLSPYYPLLAYHYERAATADELDTALAAKALDYLELAAEQSVRNYANEEALEFLKQAIRLNKTLHVPAMRQVKWHRRMAQASLALARLTESLDHYKTALALQGRPIPKGIAGTMLILLRRLGRQIIHETLPRRLWQPRNQTEAQRAQLMEAALTFAEMGIPYYLTNAQIESVLTALSYLNLAERAGESAELAYAYAQMSVVASFVPLRNLARDYSQRAMQLLARFNRPDLFISSAIAIAASQSGEAQWDLVDDLLEPAYGYCKELNDDRQAAESLSFLTLNAYLSGRPERGDEYASLLYETATQSNNPLHLTWSMHWKTYYDLIRGNPAAAASKLSEIEGLMSRYPDLAVPIILSSTAAMQAHANLQMGELDLAAEQAKTAIERMGGISTVDYAAMVGLGPANDTLLTLLERGHGDRAELMDWISRGIKAIKGVGRVYSSAMPSYELSRGRLLGVQSKKEGAAKAMARAATLAGQKNMPREQAAAFYHLARALPATDPRRREWLENARDLLTRIEANYLLGLVNEELG